MTEVNEEVQSVVLGEPNEQVIVEEVKPPEAPELKYEYQPVDDSNRPLGGRQVLTYKTHEELVEKLTKQNTELVKALRKEKKKNLLGQTEKEEIPGDITLSENFAEPRELTPDENLQLSRDLIDPEKASDARARLIEAELGANPKQVRNKLAAVDLLLARSECDAFLASEPRYYKCPENFETLTSWMVKNNLAPKRSNFKYAFDRLYESDYLITAPIVREEVPVAVVPVAEPVAVATVVNSQPPVEQPSRITSEEPPQAKRPNVGVASGLTRETASNEGVPVNSSKLTLAEIDKMPSNVYRERLKDPAFRKAVDLLLNPQPVQQ